MEDIRNIRWPGWEVKRLIGRGSYGSVYEIRKAFGAHEDRAALKVISIPQNNSEIFELRKEGYDDDSITQYFGDSLTRIENEYAIMADMKGHSNIVHCEDIRKVQHEDGLGWDIYIKMELLTPLKESIGSSITEEEIIKLGIDLCKALEMCESKKICHRDIKPENIFVSRDGTYKLGDFGIAKTMEGTASGTKIGTYEFMAPEVYNNRPYNKTTDIYSLGMVMYWLLNNLSGPFLPNNGQKPTPSMKEAARARRFSGKALPAPVNGGEELKKYVLKACEFEPANRFHTATAMRIALESLSIGGDDPNKTVGPNDFPGSEPEKPRKKNGKLANSVVGGAIIAAVILTVVLSIGDLNDNASSKSSQNSVAYDTSETEENVMETNTEPVKEYIYIVQQPEEDTSVDAEVTVNYETYPELKLTDFYVSPDGVFAPKDGEILPKQFTIPESKDGITVTCIGYSVLSNREYVTDIRLPDTVTRLAGRAFYSCDNLKSISIPASVNDFSNTAFSDCNKLSDIYYGGTKQEWDNLCSDFDLTFPSNCTVHYEC